MTLDPFATVLRESRKSRDLTQSDLAERAGCSESAIAKFETGKRRPSVQVAESLADALGISGKERNAFLHTARGTIPAAGDGDILPPTNVPSQLTSLVGREDEISKLDDLLQNERVRLLTVVGPPGIGKTRLAIEAGSRLLDKFEDGVFLVALAPVSDPAQVLLSIARVFSLRDTGHEPISLTLKDHLRNKKILLVLDNFEQVIEAATAIAELLAQCPKLKVLVTSRELLHVRGEHHFSVAPLRMPNRDGVPKADEFYKYPAIRLFVDRAQEALPGFQLTEENVEAVSRICDIVDGLPLGIELVAARTRLLLPNTLVGRLQDARWKSELLTILGGGARDLPSRHRSLRNAIGWSYDLLNEEERLLFNRLGVFSGGWTLASAEAVCNAHGDIISPILDGVASLLDKNLLKKESDTAEQRDQKEPRFSMLETIREYALEKLEASGKIDEVKQWHAEYFLVIAKATEPHLVGPEQQIWLRKLDDEHENLLAALNFLINKNEIEIAVMLAAALTRFWVVHGHLNEGRRWFGQLLAKDQELSPHARARALNSAGQLTRSQGDYDKARAMLEECVAIYRQINDKPGIAVALKDLGTTYDYQGDLDQATVLYRQALEQYRELDDWWGIAACLNNLGTMSSIMGKREEGRTFYGEALAISRKAGDKSGIARALNNIAFTYYQDKDYDPALLTWKESLTLLEEVNDQAMIGIILTHLGHIAYRTGEFDEAAELCERSLKIHRRMGDKNGIARSLSYLSDTLVARGDYDRALDLLRECLLLLREMTARLSILSVLESFAKVATLQKESARAIRLYAAVSVWRDNLSMPLAPAESAEPEHYLGTARSQLQANEQESNWQAGAAMSLDDAIAYALLTTDGQTS